MSVQDITALKKISASKRAKAYVALDKKLRIRIARRMDRGLVMSCVQYILLVEKTWEVRLH